MAISLDQFQRQLLASGVASDDEVQAWLNTAAEASRADGEQFARELVRQKKLTGYQAQQIYANKGSALVLGNYVILDQLGQGGMGLVLKARHRRMDRIVALKVMSTEAMKSPEAVRRFQREAQAAAKLDHPNIVTAFDADEARGTHFLVMQFVEGRDLSSLVKQKGPMSVKEAVRCIEQAARGLEYAHEHGVIHRDIKPANLLMDGRGNVRILDMGLARIEGDSSAHAELTSTGAVMGTVDYMAPEQALSTKSADARSDIYSLGISLWYLLTGKAAYDGETLMAKLLAHRDEPIPTLAAVRGDVPPELQAIFGKMVAKKANDRYQTMTEVLRDLEGFQSGLSSRGDTVIRTAEVSSANSFHIDLDAGSISNGAATRVRSSESKPAISNPAAEATLVGGDTQFALKTSSGIRKQQRQRRTLLFAGAGVAVVLLLGIVVFSLPRRSQKVNASDKQSATAGTRRKEAAAPTSTESGVTAGKSEALKWLFSIGATVGTGEVYGYRPFSSAAEALASNQPVTSISLSHKSFADSELARLALFPELTHVNLNGTGCGDEGLSHVKSLRKLRILGIDDTSVTDQGLLAIQDCPLQQLFMSGTNLGSDAMAIVARFTGLEHLGLAGQTKITDESLVHLDGLKSLHAINLNGCTGLTDKCCVSLAKLPRLADLRLTGLPISAAGLRDLSASGLAVLWLNDCSAITDDCGVELAKFPKLRHLELTGCPISARGLQGLSTAPSLGFLSLSNCPNIDTAGCEALARLPALEVVHLSSTKVNDDCIRALATAPKLREIIAAKAEHLTDGCAVTLGQMPKLDSLNLEGSPLGDKVFEGLRQLPKLRLLHMGSTRVTDAAVPLISQLPSLELIAIGNTQFTQEGVQQLAKAAPWLHIVSNHGEFQPTQPRQAKMPQAMNQKDALDWLFSIGAEVGSGPVYAFKPFKSTADALASNQPITVIVMRNKSFLNSDLRRLTVFSDLLQLNAGYSSLNDEGLVHVKSLRKLQSLSADHTAISDAGLANLQDCPLEELNLTATNVTSKGLTTIEKLTRLKGLSLFGLTKVTDQSLDQLEGLKSLYYLELTNCTGLTDKCCALLAKLPALRDLRLAGVPIGPAGLRDLSASGLDVLWLNDCSTITDDCGAELAKFPKLQHLELAGCPIGARGLQGLSTAPALGFLLLRSCPNIDTAGCEALARLPALEVVHLSYTKVNDDCIRALATAPKLREIIAANAEHLTDDCGAILGQMLQLDSLNLEGTQLGDKVFEGLKKLPKLRLLHMGDTRLTDAAVPFISQLPSLELIALGNTQFTANGVQKLAKAAPWLRILSSHGGFQATQPRP